MDSPARERFSTVENAGEPPRRQGRQAGKHAKKSKFRFKDKPINSFPPWRIFLLGVLDVLAVQFSWNVGTRDPSQ
jgi:hypothetical protein